MISCVRNIKWPAHLQEIHLEEKEKEILEKAIAQCDEENKAMPWRLRGEVFSLERYFIFGCIGSNGRPRRIVFSGDRILVVLNNHGGMPCFYDHANRLHRIKYVWDCFSGSFWLKKQFRSPLARKPLKDFVNFPAVGHSELGQPGLVVDSREVHGHCYFEQKLPYTLAEGLEKFGRTLHSQCLVGLIDAVRKIHLQEGTVDDLTASFIKDGHLACFRSERYTLFHGNIHPDKIFCDEWIDESTGKVFPRFILSGFSHLNHLCSYSKPGWNSPEYVKYQAKRAYFEKYGGCFAADYGVKRDTWALGLLLGYLFLGEYKHSSLPNFKFLIRRLLLDPSEKYVIDESGLEKISQGEIHAEIDEIIKNLPSDDFKVFWEYIRGCLVVDPDLRPTVGQHYLSLAEIKMAQCPEKMFF